MKEPISIKEILAMIIRRGKAILCVALIGAVLGGIYQYSQGVKESKLPEYSAEAIEQNYAQAMEAYQIQKQQLETEINSLDAYLNGVQQRIALTPAMQINSGFAPTCVLSFSIGINSADTNLEYYTYTEERIEKIAQHYCEYFNQVFLQTELLNHPYVGFEESVLRELISFSYLGGGLIEISVCGLNNEDAAIFADAILDLLLAYKPTVDWAVQTHDVYVISKINKIAYNSQLQETQNKWIGERENTSVMLNEKIVVLNNLAEPQRESGYDFSPVYKKAVIFAVVGAVLFAIMACAWILAVYIICDGLESSSQFVAVLGVPFLANTAGKQKQFVRWANALIGERYWADSASAAMYAVACLQNDIPDGAEIALLSTISASEEETGVKSFVLAMSDAGYHVTVVSSSLVDPAAVRLLRECDKVVMAERVGKSTRKQLVDMKNVIEQMDGKLFGFILV